MLRTALLVVAGLGGLALTLAGGSLAAMFLGSVSDSDRTTGGVMVAGLVVWLGLHVLGWRLSARKPAGLVVLGAVAALDVLGVVALLAAIEAAARP